MERTKTTWLSTKDLMKRWNCGANAVSQRVRRAAVAEPTKWGRVNYMKLEDVERVENALGVADLVADLNRGDDG